MKERKKKYFKMRTLKEYVMLNEERNGMIDKDLNKNLGAMVGFRNIAVHDYKKINLEIVRMIIEKHLEDFNEYIYYINKLL